MLRQTEPKAKRCSYFHWCSGDGVSFRVLGLSADRVSWFPCLFACLPSNRISSHSMFSNIYTGTFAEENRVMSFNADCMKMSLHYFYTFRNSRAVKYMKLQNYSSGIMQVVPTYLQEINFSHINFLQIYGHNLHDPTGLILELHLFCSPTVWGLLQTK